MKNTALASTPVLAIRMATADDAAVIRRLAALDSRSVPAFPVLIGTLDDAPAAAVSLNGQQIVADPFQPTAALVALLRLRADHLHGPARGPDRRIAGRAMRLPLALRGRHEAA